MTTRHYVILILVCLLLGACHSASAPAIGAGIGGALLALDQMLVGGSVTPEQHHAIQQGIVSLQQGVEAASQLAGQVKSGALTPSEGAGIAGSLVVAGLAAHNKWRNLTRQTALASAAQVQARPA